MNKITTENWNFSYFSRGDLKACITIAAEPNSDIEYMLTLLDPKNNEIHQGSFAKLDSAAEKINSEYGHWDYINMETEKNKNTNSSGCSSCQAH